MISGPPAVRVVVAPASAAGADRVARAVVAAGAERAPAAEAQALIWLGADPAELAAELAGAPAVRWVQLPSAGVEDYLPLMTDGRLWTRAHGVHGRQVAEHALMLILVCLRDAAASVRARRWSPRPAIDLAGEEVLIVGGGSIATELAALLRPFGATVTMVRRSSRPTAAPTGPVLAPDRLDTVLPRARVVCLAAPLTAETSGLINAARLALMRTDACLVNVARGGLVVTDDLVAALRAGQLAAAGLDVTDPEPLPDGHPLWQLPNCFITGHCAADLAGVLPAFVTFTVSNLDRWRAGEPLLGVVDTERGY